MLAKSRLKKNEQRKAVLRIFITVSLSFLLITATIIYLPQLILGITTINSKIIKEDNIKEDEKTDEIPPLPPKLNSLPKATQENKITISGTAEPESEIRLYLNNSFVDDTISDSDGKFEFKDIRLRNEDNEFYTIAIDSSGNESNKSAPQKIALKTDAPKLEVSSETDSKKGVTVIIGTTDFDAKITINNRRVVVKRDGSFTSIFKLTEGENKFEIIATDPANNKTTKDLSVTYEPET